MKFRKELYSKIALIKAAYHFTDLAYLHLDADEEYYYVSIEPKTPEVSVTENDFINEMLTQSVRHEVYQQTKNIRELLLARAMATSIIADSTQIEEQQLQNDSFLEETILKDWYMSNENTSD